MYERISRKFNIIFVLEGFKKCADHVSYIISSLKCATSDTEHFIVLILHENMKSGNMSNVRKKSKNI